MSSTTPCASAFAPLPRPLPAEVDAAHVHALSPPPHPLRQQGELCLARPASAPPESMCQLPDHCGRLAGTESSSR